MQLNNMKIMLLNCTCMCLISLTSCNFFFLPLHGRENADDPEAQIYNIFAYQTGEHKVTASFTWRDVFFNYDEETAIEEAVMVYNVGEALPVRSIPLPPDSGGIVGFDFNDGQYIYSKIIDGLEEGEAVWFALYPRTERRWLAPLYESIVVEEYPPALQTEPLLAVDRIFVDDGSGYMQEIEIGSDTYTLEGTFSRYIALQFDIPKRVLVSSAFLRIQDSAGLSGLAWAYPVSFRHINGVDAGVIQNFIDKKNGVQFDLSLASAVNATADITAAVNAAIIYETNTILITLDSSNSNTFNNNSGPEALQQIEYTVY